SVAPGLVTPDSVSLHDALPICPAGWHEEPVSSLSEDDVPVYNADGTLKTTTAEDGTVTYYRNVRTQAAMVTLDYDGNVVAMVGRSEEHTSELQSRFELVCRLLL